MTPAIMAAKRAKISYLVHEYLHNSDALSYGEEAASALGVHPERVFKTLLVALAGQSNRLAVGVVPVSSKLNLKAMAKVLGAKKVTMADPAVAERITGYVVGGISPLGQKKRLPMVLDTSAQAFETIFVSAGKRGLEIELTASALMQLTAAVTGEIS